jgi:hypothetical protein
MRCRINRLIHFDRVAGEPIRRYPWAAEASNRSKIILKHDQCARDGALIMLQIDLGLQIHTASSRPRPIG